MSDQRSTHHALSTPAWTPGRQRWYYHSVRWQDYWNFCGYARVSDQVQRSLTMIFALRAVVVGAFAILSASLATAQDRVGWTRFHEPQAGASVDYPSSVFSTMVGPSKRGIGRRFVSRDGRSMLSVYSLRNPAGDTPSSFVRKNIRADLRRVDYERITPRFLALSTASAGRIFYTRCNFGRSRIIHCFEVAYPAEEKRAWDSVVTRMSHSLGSS
jgi:hypothetical protein